MRREILTGARAAGSWLREGDIAQELGVSRTPVREALRRLGAEGLVRHEFNRGVRVASWSARQVDEVFILRATLEPLAASLSAERGVADLERARRLAEQMDECVSRPEPDYARLTHCNNEFHRLIAEASGHERLARMLAALVEVPLVHRTFEQYSPQALQRSLAHHHELVDALAARDAEWAESVMRSHVRAAWSTVHNSQEKADV